MNDDLDYTTRSDVVFNSCVFTFWWPERLDVDRDEAKTWSIQKFLERL